MEFSIATSIGWLRKDYLPDFQGKGDNLFIGRQLGRISSTIKIGGPAHPVQPLAVGMEPESLKKEFGTRIVFHGGVDIQKLLPNGTPQEVAAGTQRCLQGFQADCGGFILAPSHNVQADVPPENIIAMIEAAKHWSRP